MLIWIVFAVIATAVIASLLHPFASGLARIDSGAADACRVYRDQLVDLDRDMETSQLPRNEDEYARAEIARRLLPDMPSQPLQARLEDPGHNIAMLISKTERHLASQPDDGRGWNVIAPVYLRTGRIAEAQSAYRNALRILGPDVDRLGGLAEALMIEAQGSVTADTLDILRQILRLEPKNPRALFYIAVGMEQAGRTTEALADFEALAKLSPAGAAWLPLVNQHISANGGVPLAASRQKPHMTAAGDSR
ncbi:c-type cytochrome biogenesis protein CcmI (plasmid) [Rhizobium sp. YTUHZ044]|uniref:c-type cytochrome biogenesis protein CcmI n=1 Tax=Rhizobium sp. YTUHZ044 TaxID=2962678 RepID=UPI003DA8A91A